MKLLSHSRDSTPSANNRHFTRKVITDHLLLAIPFCVYGISYGYLAYYHDSLNLFQTVVHEGGTHTLLETIFYAPHFLGHVPVYTVLALYFTGVFLNYQDGDGLPVRLSGLLWALLLILLLVGSFILSIKHFGSEYTYSYILQSRQSVSRYETGGAWNLHLPSTVLLFFFIPVYIYFLKIFFCKSIGKNSHGNIYVILSILVFVFMTVLVNRDLKTPFFLWENPRYLAHSVRELATFPVIYFPIVAFFFFKNNPSSDVVSPLQKKRQQRLIPSFFCIFLLGFGYQVIVSLSSGIGALAQKPSFARGGNLGIFYLLSSHYFEHVLDMIYFILLCLLLFSLSDSYLKRRQHSDRPSGPGKPYE